MSKRNATPTPEVVEHSKKLADIQSNVFNIDVNKVDEVSKLILSSEDMKKDSGLTLFTSMILLAYRSRVKGHSKLIELTKQLISAKSYLLLVWQDFLLWLCLLHN